MEVDVAVAGEVKHPLGDDAAVGYDENGVWLDGLELRAELLVVLDLLRLYDGDAVRLSGLLYGRGLEFHAATCGTVWLGDDKGDLVAGEDCFEGWYGELGCSAED
jgi:hypothetical protein